MPGSTATRFALDEDKARKLIARALRRNQSGTTGPAPDYESVALAPRWSPREVDQEPTVSDLVYAARTCGAITQPAGTEIDFEYQADTDGGMYQWSLYQDGHHGLRFGSAPEEYRRLGDRQARGTAGQAMAILLEAVRSANQVLRDLERYVASQQPTFYVLEWSDYKYGTSLEAFTTQEQADAARVQIARDNWGRVSIRDGRDEADLTDDEVSEVYFKHADAIGELAIVHELDVTPASGAQPAPEPAELEL